MKISEDLINHLEKVGTWEDFRLEYNIIHKKDPAYANTIAGMLEIARGLNKIKRKYLIIGGLAVASYLHQGDICAFREWRGTSDIDLLADKKIAESILKKADYSFAQTQKGKIGIIGRLYDYTKEDNGETTVVGLREKIMGENGRDITDYLLNHRSIIPVHGVHVSVPQLRDLVKMKRFANRKKDREDVKILKKLAERI